MIVEVCEQEAQGRTSVDNVADYLLRHKAIVGAKAYLNTNKPVADEILRFAQEAKSDLIVAGGYGHSLLGEWIFGGVTRHLLRKYPAMLSVFTSVPSRRVITEKEFHWPIRAQSI